MNAVKDLEGRYTYGDYRMVRKCVDAVLDNYPAVQAIYLFGSWGTVPQRPDSDMDVALLLPFEMARREKEHLPLSCCAGVLADVIGASIDLVRSCKFTLCFYGFSKRDSGIGAENLYRRFYRCSGVRDAGLVVLSKTKPREGRDHRGNTEDRADLLDRVGFRNIAVHEYQTLDVSILMSVIKNELEGALFF